MTQDLMMRPLIKLFAFILAAGFYQSAYATTFALKGNTEVVGEVRTIYVQGNENFEDYMYHYDLGGDQLIKANPGVDQWNPALDTRITIPTQFVLPRQARNGIVVNLPELRLYYFDRHSGQVSTYPISIGKPGWRTPLTKTQITQKELNPVWDVPDSIMAEHAAKGERIRPVVPSGPDNPLGYHAFHLGIPGYLIHGTNSPIGVGRQVTHGCMRMFPDDIETLFSQVPVNTPVQIINEPIKAGWKGDYLYLEVHPILSNHALSEAGREALLKQMLQSALADKKADINWNTVDSVMNAESGVPRMIGQAL